MQNHKKKKNGKISSNNIIISSCFRLFTSIKSTFIKNGKIQTNNIIIVLFLGLVTSFTSAFIYDYCFVRPNHVREAEARANHDKHVLDELQIIRDKQDKLMSERIKLYEQLKPFMKDGKPNNDTKTMDILIEQINYNDIEIQNTIQQTLLLVQTIHDEKERYTSLLQLEKYKIMLRETNEYYAARRGDSGPPQLPPPPGLGLTK